MLIHARQNDFNEAEIVKGISLNPHQYFNYKIHQTFIKLTNNLIGNRLILFKIIYAKQIKTALLFCE